MMYPQYYGAQLVPHSPATPGSVPLFSSSPMTSATGSLLPSPPPPLKRSTSDDSSDDELDPKSLQMADSNMDGNCHMMNRKKRRGLIEKRRRDRINNSLHELKRLVPAAFEKQGSAKLEKAEILQLTVDHLRMLHAKGFDAFSFDPHKFATDYHLIGFRECAAEVARYLVVHEGIDFQDPLRLRLISHMQCYAAQRELSLKSSSGWNPSLFTTPMYPVQSATAASSSTTATASSTTTSAPAASSNGSSCTTGSAESMSGLTNSGTSSSSQHHSSQYGGNSSTYPHYSQLESSMMAANGASSNSMSCNSNSHSAQSANVKHESSAPSGSGSMLGSSAFSTVTGYTSMATASTSSYSYSYPTGTYFAPNPASYMAPMMPASQSTSSNSQNSVKHYRPWGTELAY